MAVESKPLFHPEVLRQQVRSFVFSEQTVACQPKLHHWAGLITSGSADTFKESELLPDYLTDIFCGLLGYTGPLGPAHPHNSHNSHPSHLSDTVRAESPDSYTLSRERHLEVDGKFADAVLGRFQKDKEEFIAVVEGKGTRDPLERPFAGRRMSAVDQAYRYAIIDVDILGHIFEQSITDLERLRQSLSSAGFQPAVSPTSSRQGVGGRAACGLENRPAPHAHPPATSIIPLTSPATHCPEKITWVNGIDLLEGLVTVGTWRTNCEYSIRERFIMG
jgi:hypothetical protein